MAERLTRRHVLGASAAVLLAACGSPSVSPGASPTLTNGLSGTTPTPANPPSAASTVPSPSAAPNTAAPSTTRAISPLGQRATIRLALSPANLYPLPILYGMDKDYFNRAGLDIQVTKYTSAATALAPMLARGDFDLAPQTPAPAFYNLVPGGFSAKVVAAFGRPTPGRAEEAWLAVKSSEADTIKTIEDLKGKVIEGAVEGSTASFLALAAIQQAGLTPGQDVTLEYHLRQASDFLTLAQHGQQDVIGMIEPAASQAEQLGYITRWKGVSSIAPWLQTILLVSSDQFIQNNPDALEKFLEVHLQSVREVNAANGQWTDELMRLITEWTEFDPATIMAMGGVPYFEPNGTPSLESLERAQQVWLDARVLQQHIDLSALVDTHPLERALASMGSVG